MPGAETDAETLVFRGSMRAGSFTAQLSVALTVTPRTLTLRALGRSFLIERQNLVAIEDTSILRIFKRGLRFRHTQPGIPDLIDFYPSLGRDVVRERIRELGWSDPGNTQAGSQNPDRRS